MTDVLCNGGWDEGVWDACGPFGLSTDYEEETVGCGAECRHG